MNPKGTIRKGGVTHRVYEAILTHPNSQFSSTDIWESLRKDYPDIKKASVSGLMTNKKSLIRELFHDSGRGGKKGQKRFTRKRNPPIRPIYVPEEQTPKDTKRLSPKPQPISDTVTDHQIGQSIILYIEELKRKIKDMATSIGDLQAKSRSEIGKLRMEIRSKEDTNKKLNDELKVLRAQKNTSARTFNMSDIANFRR